MSDRVPTLTSCRTTVSSPAATSAPTRASSTAMLATVGRRQPGRAARPRRCPSAIRLREPLDLPAGRTEHEVLAELRALAERNQVAHLA